MRLRYLVSQKPAEKNIVAGVTRIMIFSYIFILNQLCFNMASMKGGADLHRHYNRGASYRAWKGQSIIDDKMRGYDRHRRPYPRVFSNGTIAPVVVTTSLVVKSLGTVKEQNMEFKAQFRFQQEWYDERLSFDDYTFRELEFVHLAQDPKQKIWIPDTFFQNEKAGETHKVDQDNYFIKIRHDGKVIYNRRLSMTFSCNMYLLKYPMDTQECFIDFATYAYTTDDIIYEWDMEPLKFLPDSTSALTNFFVTDRHNASCTSITTTGTYSCLRVVIKFRRVFSFFILQLYIPSSMLVAVSWVSYWIDWRATAGRVPLAIITLLTMIAQSHVINANLPPVSYTKAIDVWIGACVVFIFGSLLEYAFVNYTGIQEQTRKASLAMANSKTASGLPKTMTNGRFGEAVWEKFMGRSDSTISKSEKRRRISDQLFQNDSTLAAHILESSPERMALLKRRSASHSISRRGHQAFQEAMDDITHDSFDQSMQLRRRHAMSSSVDPCLSENAVHFEDISANLDLIRLRTRRRVELLQWCRFFKQRSRAERIDFMSRMLFPVAFIMFNIVYWTIYW